jgi:hypothetical protein
MKMKNGGAPSSDLMDAVANSTLLDLEAGAGAGRPCVTTHIQVYLFRVISRQATFILCHHVLLCSFLVFGFVFRLSL